MAIEYNIYSDSISQFANDKSVLWEGVYNQKNYDYININVGKSIKWLSNSWVVHNNHQTNMVTNSNIPVYHNMVDIKLYGVSETGWLVAQSKNLDFNYLNFPYHEGSTAGRTTFITNNIKNSDIHTIMSHIYNQCTICGVQGECNKKYRTESPSICLCNSQYIYGQSTNTKICCTQQSAHSCQVSNSSLDIQRSMPSLSGSFLRSSANFSKAYNDNLCTGGCRELINGEMSDIRCFHKYYTSYNKQNQGYAASDTSSSYFEKFNGIISPKGLAACHSHDSQHLYSKQEQSFCDLE